MRGLQFRGTVESGEARMETQVVLAPVNEPRLYHAHIACSWLWEGHRRVEVLWEDGVDLGAVVKRDDTATVRIEQAPGASLSLLRGWGHKAAIRTPHWATHRGRAQKRSLSWRRPSLPKPSFTGGKTEARRPKVTAGAWQSWSQSQSPWLPGGALASAAGWLQGSLCSPPSPAMALHGPSDSPLFKGTRTPWQAWMMRGEDVCKGQHRVEHSGDRFFCPLSPTSTVTGGT